MLNYERIKAIEESFGPKAQAVISALQDLDKRIEEQKTEVKKDLFVELATKADIAILGGDIKRLEGKLDTQVAKLEGRFSRLEVFMKVLIGLAIIAIALFSPAAGELIKLLK